MDTADGQRDPFLAACQGRPGSRTPVWFMRQAGRSLPEYRAARGEGSMLDTVRDPALAAELTLQPVRRYHVDAAILYSDIMVPLAATSFGVEVKPGIGPVGGAPVPVDDRPGPPASVRTGTGRAAGSPRLSASWWRTAPYRLSASPAARSRWPATWSRAARLGITSVPSRSCTPNPACGRR